MKKAARTYCAAIKRESYKTGGGVANVTQNILLERLNEVMGETLVYGLLNSFDSDAIDKENINIEILDNNDDSNEHNPNEVFSYLMENKTITNWKSWDSKKLKSKLSPPLKDEDNTQASSSDSTYKKRKTTQYSKKTLDEVKTELAETLKVNVEEKKEYEIEQLKAKLEKEKLKIKLLKVLVEKEKGVNTKKLEENGIFKI